MNIIEFQTYIDHGTIAVPQQYLAQVKGRARVIIVVADPEDEGDMIKFLLEHPYQVADFTPLTRAEIYERE